MRQVRRAQVTPVLDTNAYASGDQMSTLQNIDVCSNGGRSGGEITLITVMDKVTQSVALDLFFFDRSVTLAADNAAVSISDADMVFCLGVVNVLVSDYDATAVNSIATVSVNLPVMAADAGKRIFMAIVSRGAPTYAASSLVISVNAVLEEAGV